MSFWQSRGEGLDLLLQIQPGAKTPSIKGVSLLPDGRRALKLAIDAPAQEGRANQALLLFLAQIFGLPRRALTLLSGEKSRIKRLRLSGDPASLALVASSLVAQGPQEKSSSAKKSAA